MSITMRMAVGMFACTWAIQAAAQQYPSKPVRVGVPYAPGGGVDFGTRIVSRHLGNRMGVQFAAISTGGRPRANGPLASAQTPPDIISRLNGEANAVLDLSRK